MTPADDHSDHPNSGGSRPGPRSWLDTYVDHRLAELDRELSREGTEADSDSGGDPGGLPPDPGIAARDLAPYLAELAERYRRRSA